VTVIDGATNGVIATVTVGSRPYALCYNPTSNKVYCANAHGGSVTVIDGQTNGVIATLTAGNYPCALCCDTQNNTVYCANYNGGNVTVISGATNAVVATIGVGDGPSDFAWNPLQNRVYVANYLGSSISVLRDSGGGIEESRRLQPASSKPDPTIVRGVLSLQVDSRQQSAYRVELLDATGRKVMDLGPGANDVRALAPGVYFVRRPKTEDGRPAADISKVVVTR